MKNRKKLFKCSVLLLFFIFFINGCQTDDTIIIATNGSEKPTIQNLSFDNAKNIPDFLEVTNSFKVNQILNKEKEQKNSRNQNKFSENNFTINTQTFNRFQKENYISYTFEINKEKNINKNFFQNLVIERKNGKIKGYILKYQNPYYVKDENNLSLKAEILKKDKIEVVRIINNIMTFKYTGFGGKIVTNPNKTTTVIGKWQNETKEIIDSGLSKSGKNTGGLNVLSEIPNPSWNNQQIWDNINEPWLRNAVNRNDIIRVVSNPLDNNNLLNPDFITLSFFGREHELLTKPVSNSGLGYIYNPLTFTYIK